MGRVYRGVDPDSGEVVAVKTILEERMTSPAALPRFLREMQILAGLDHPNIVRIRDRGICDGGHYLVMDFLDGRPVDEVIRDEEIDRERALRWSTEIGEALAYLHQNGVMHRDLKPGNLILTTEDTIRLIDFGLSRFLEPGGTVTGVGRVIGSPHYLPPEQWRGERPDARADVYQFGILMLELLTGQVPFSGTDLRAIMDSCLNYGVTEALLETMGVEGPLAQFLMRCTARAKQERYQEMSEALEDLHRVQRGEPLKERVDPPTLIESASFELDSDTGDVDLDAPTAEKDAPRVDPRAAASFHRPGNPVVEEARRRRRGGAVAVPVAEPPRGFVPVHLPPAVWVAMAVVMAMTGGILWVASRPPPPPPLPALLAGPRVVDGVAAARVEWETDRPTLGRLEVVGPEGLQVLHDEEGTRRDHAVTLVDLRPGERYRVQVRGPQGALGEPVSFTARGVSIAFNPLFTERGLELHWKSEDPLVLQQKSSATENQDVRFHSKEGKLVLQGVRPGAGRVTVLAFSPLGSVLPVVWTVPEVESIAEAAERMMRGLADVTTRRDFDEAMARQDPFGAADVLRAAAREAAGGMVIRSLFEQTGLVLEHPDLPRDRKARLMENVAALRMMLSRLEPHGVDPPVPMHLLRTRGFAWGAAPGIRPDAEILAEWSPPPAPLVSLAPGMDPRRSELTWPVRLRHPPAGEVVTLAVHCNRLSPYLALRARVGVRGDLVLFTDAEVFDLEAIDQGEGWTMLLHTFDPKLLPLKGGEIRLNVQAMSPALAGRAVAIRRLEILEGAYLPEGVRF